MKNNTGWSVGLLLLAFAVGCTCQDVFSEELLTSWLSSSHLLVHLRFDQGTTASRLHTSFPHGIQHLAKTLPLHQVELSLTSGRWRYTDWGWPLVPAKPVGAVLDASFRSGLLAPVLAEHWTALVNALSGLSCASLGLLRAPSSVSVGRIRLQELLADGNSTWAEGNGEEAGTRLHAMLPHEPLCTENLTPWLRLLPCRDQAGLASLLRHRPTVFKSEYISMGLLLEPRATARGHLGVHLVQTFTLVLRTSLLPAQQPGQPGSLDLDLEHLLSARVDHFCPAATRSEAFVAEPGNRAATAALSTTGAACAAEDTDDGSGTRGSCPSEAAPADAVADATSAPDESSLLLLPWNVRDGSQPALVAGLSRAFPPLHRYDTLEQLEVHGGGLGLPLFSMGRQSQYGHAQAGAGTPAGLSVGSMRRATVPGASAFGAGGADLVVDRYATGAGLLRGGLVLRIQRSMGLRARLAASHGAVCAGADSGECCVAGGAEGDVGAVCAWSLLCVHQVFPWYVRPWLHTLVLLYDGQEVPLRQHLVAQQLRPALQRASPGVLDLCLQVPAAVAEVQLRLAFSKAFLTVFEYPPDAHRGFDIPAAVVSYPDPLYAPAVQWCTAAPAEAGLRAGGGNGGTADQDGGHGGGDGEVTSPLLASLSEGPMKQVYTAGLLVPLAAPDFSMPYNVICLSSTVLAVYFGAVLNLLARRARPKAGVASAKPKTPLMGKVLQALLMVALFAALALYLDAELRKAAEGMLARVGLSLSPNTPGCGSRDC